jgi:hypothetical protein
MQNMFLSPGTRLKYPNLPSSNHIDAGAILIFPKNDLSFPKIHEPGHGGQTAKTFVGDVGKQLAFVQNFDNILRHGGFFSPLDIDQGRFLAKSLL